MSDCNIRLLLHRFSGTLAPSDGGFFLAASVDLLLREVQWLISLLHLTQGPSSPHLKALLAVLKVDTSFRFSDGTRW